MAIRGAIGVLILDSVTEEELYRHGECIGHTTNNRAEYKALIAGLDQCAKYTRGQVICFTDSELVVKQMNGVWRLKDDTLRSLFHEVKDRERAFERVICQHVRRDNTYIREVDRIVNEALEGR